MKISTLLSQGRPTLSFEVFPPKGDGEFSAVRQAALEIAALKPDFMSVTYGAAGSGASFSPGSLASAVQEQGMSALAHLTCVSSTREETRSRLLALRSLGIENILALRGDLPAGMDPGAPRDYRYAADLVHDLRAVGDFSVGGACYPEGHVECSSQAEDLCHLKEKVEMGCDFLITQMFFDNSILYSFLYRMEAAGIHVPVIAGVMPVTNAKQIYRIVKLSNASLPHRFRMIIDKFGDDPAAMKQAGVAYATEQIVDLIANGIRGVHIYVMNKPDVAAQITANLSEILRR